MCIDIVEFWFGIANGQILSNFELPAQDTPIFSFTDDNLRKLQWIFTKLDMCIDIVEIGLRLLMGKFRQILTELSARNKPIFSFPDDNLSKYRDFNQTWYMHWYEKDLVWDC